MSLRILYVAYPLLPVTEESCGGAEQVLATLEGELARRGHLTVVAAAEGSRVGGELFATGAATWELDRFEQRSTEHRRRILQLLAHDDGFDLVHDMSGWLFGHAAEIPVPLLATLHLPPSLYAPDAFADFSPRLHFNCVSQSQARAFAELPGMAGVVVNGIALERFERRGTHSDGRQDGGSREHLLWLGRICEEKGAHLALDAAERAGLPIVLAGEVYPFSYHQQYFEREVIPRLRRNPQARLVQSPSLAAKISLLRAARAVLIPSLVDETSSLTAMEAMACGTPVVAFRRGALPEVVDDSVTGFVVESLEPMIEALDRLPLIRPQACRERVARRFSAARMADDYEKLYAHILMADRGAGMSAA